MDDPVNLNFIRAERENDNNLVSPLEMVEAVARDLRLGHHKATSAIVILLDTGPENSGRYETMQYASQIKCSEAIALLEIAKAKYIDWMK
jgi:hypothetical protein